MKGPENLGENHTVIQTQKLIQLQTWNILKTNLGEL